MYLSRLRSAAFCTSRVLDTGDVISYYETSNQMLMVFALRSDAIINRLVCTRVSASWRSSYCNSNI